MIKSSPPSALPVARTLFQTENFPRNERFGLWRDSVSPLFDSLPHEANSPAGFQAQVDSFDLERMFFAMSSFSKLRFRREKNYQGDDGADHLVVQLYLEGGYTGYNGHREVDVQPGDISLLDLGRPMETRARTSKALTLVIPRDLLFSFVKPQQIASGAVVKAGSAMGNILGNHLTTVWENLGTASIDELATINRTLLGTVVGAFGAGNDCPDLSASAMEGATLEAIQTYIRQHLHHESLGPSELCARFACSRTQLYRLFAPLGGVSAYIRECRLARCLEEFSQAAEGRTRVVDVAMRWGFSSHSHFCRLFKQAFGLSPSEAIERGREQAVVAHSGMRDPGLDKPLFHDWLRRL